MKNKLHFVIFSVLYSALLILPGCRNEKQTLDQSVYDETETKRYIYYLREKKLGDRSRDAFGVLSLHHYPLHGMVRDLSVNTLFVRKVQKESIENEQNVISLNNTLNTNGSRILCDNNVNYTSNDKDYNYANNYNAVLNKELLSICDYWNNYLGDTKAQTITENDRYEIDNIKGKLLEKKGQYINEVFVISDIKSNSKEYDKFWSNNALEHILLKIQKSHLEQRNKVAPILFEFSLPSPLIALSPQGDMINDLLYDNNLLPVISAGQYFSLKETLVMETNENTPIGEYFDLTSCRNYLSNCVHSGNSFYSRNPHAIIVASSNEKGDKISTSTVGTNIWVTATGEESNNVKAVEKVGMAILDILSHNNTLTIEQVKYILAKTADPSLGELSFLGDKLSIGWQKNGAGFKYSNELGFGQINIDDAISLAENCNFENSCARRSAKPDVNYVLSSSLCRIVSSTAPYRYSCRVVVPDNVEVENIKLRFDKASFIKTKNNAYCENIGQFSNLANRIDNTGLGYEISDVLRKLTVTINSSNTANRFIVKAKNENFFGTGVGPINIYQNKAQSDLLVNSFYGEQMERSDYFDINFESVCQLSFADNAIVLGISGYSFQE